MKGLFSCKMLILLVMIFFISCINFYLKKIKNKTDGGQYFQSKTVSVSIGKLGFVQFFCLNEISLLANLLFYMLLVYNKIWPTSN